MIIVVPQPRQLAQTGLLFGVNGASSLWRVPPLAPRRTLDRFVAIAEAPDHWLAWLGPPQLEARERKDPRSPAASAWGETAAFIGLCASSAGLPLSRLCRRPSFLASLPPRLSR